ncbi:MAG: 16S rRNA (guanine(966)-N(2))-methyltransferase RsmD [Alphaproteobacteria bacterium]
MRIIGGRLRGRLLTAPEGGVIRPTSDRAREAVFNVLTHRFQDEDWTLEGARVVDAFAGSGAMGLEALSRGAAHASFIDDGHAAMEAIRANARALGVAGEVDLLRADARHPPRATRPCTLAFLDPPYDLDVAAASLTALAGTGWLAPGALCVVETKASTALIPPVGFLLEDERVHGRAKVTILRVTDTTGSAGSRH